MSAFVEIDISFEVEGVTDPTERFEAFLDGVMDEFDKIGVEADLTAALEQLRATFLITAADRTDDEFVKAVQNVRTALHAVDCGTAGWPNSRHEILAARAVDVNELASA